MRLNVVFNYERSNGGMVCVLHVYGCTEDFSYGLVLTVLAIDRVRDK
jgi:hypothetical protein